MAATLSKEAIQQLQQQLVQRGFDIGPTGADGILGNFTRAAIKKFEQANGMKPTGLASASLMDALAAPPPPPRLRPAPDVLNANPKPASATPPAPQMRNAANVPPPDQLGTGNTNVMPRMRDRSPAGDAVANGAPAPLRKGFGTSSQPQTPRGNTPDALRQMGEQTRQMLIAAGTPPNQADDIVRQVISRATQVAQQPPPITPPAPPPVNRDADFAKPELWNSPMQMPPAGGAPPGPAPGGPPVAAGGPPPQGGGGGLLGTLGGMFAHQDPAKGDAGMGLPGLPPSGNAGSAVGDAGRAAAGALGGMFRGLGGSQPPPAQAAPAPAGGPPMPQPPPGGGGMNMMNVLKQLFGATPAQ